MDDHSTFTSSPARLDDQLCFALTKATKAVSGAYRVRLAPLGLTYPQYLVLLALWEIDGRTVSELGDAVRLESGTLSPLVRRLEQAGHVIRQRTDQDERRVRVMLTDSGRNLELPAATVRSSVEAATGLSNEEFIRLRRQLFSLAETLDHSD